MKKKLILLFVPIFLCSCNKSDIEIVKNPFKNDTYQRIGAKGEYLISEEKLTGKEFEALNKAITSEYGQTDNLATSYKWQDETRDYMYAYFGKEMSSVFLNSLTSRNDEIKRYKNNVLIEKNNSKEIIQRTSGETTSSTSNELYTYDNDYKKKELSGLYSVNLKSVKNQDKPIITKTKSDIEYDLETKEPFLISPLKKIKDSFFKADPEKKYNFKLLGDSSVYGRTIDEKNKESGYVIKEGYSIFDSKFTTKLGRKYVAVDNYFYEAFLLSPKRDNNLCFKEFRFYREKLILSEAYNGENVPILYLDKPVLVWFEEVKISIDYSDMTSYSDEIPQPEEGI